jgi:putative glutamine amidotransferase
VLPIMSTTTQAHTQERPRVGVPWRTAAEEIAGERRRYDDYLFAVREAGGDPVEVSLRLPDAALATLAESLDAVLLPGSPADIETRRYDETRRAQTADADIPRERTDGLLLDHAFATGKPVLAICYGTQLLNVHFGGSLVQDIATELHTAIDHNREELGSEPLHAVHIESYEDGRLAEIVPSQPDGAGPPREEAAVFVNSSHHQAIRRPGRGLRVAARSPDGVVEAIEWAGEGAGESPGELADDSPRGRRWIVGVQWHPERMRGDALAVALFRKLVIQAVRAREVLINRGKLEGTVQASNR